MLPCAVRFLCLLNHYIKLYEPSETCNTHQACCQLEKGGQLQFPGDVQESEVDVGGGCTCAERHSGGQLAFAASLVNRCSAVSSASTHANMYAAIYCNAVHFHVEQSGTADAHRYH